MRCYQHIGLTNEAIKFLKTTVKLIPDIVCPNCDEIIKYRQDKTLYKHIDSFYGDGPDLHKYNLVDGRIVREILQAQPWSSGPMGFLCLEDSEGNRIFPWTEDQIREMQ